MRDHIARPHGLAFGVTDGARTRDLRSHNPMLYLTELRPPSAGRFYQEKGGA